MNSLWMINHQKKNSHPTYEELKPCSFNASIASSKYSHPTYEELKLLCGSDRSDCLLDSHPTYEELKRVRQP